MAEGRDRNWRRVVQNYANRHDLAVSYDSTTVLIDENVRMFKCEAKLFVPVSLETVSAAKGLGLTESIAEGFAANALALTLLTRDDASGAKPAFELTDKPKDGLRVRKGKRLLYPRSTKLLSVHIKPTNLLCVQELNIAEKSAAEASLPSLQIRKGEDGSEPATKHAAMPAGEDYVGQLQVGIAIRSPLPCSCILSFVHARKTN